MRTSNPGPVRKAVGLSALFLALVLGSACGSTKVSTQTNSSVGQQLLDLDKAHADGIISDKEYARLKKSIVEDND